MTLLRTTLSDTELSLLSEDLKKKSVKGGFYSLVGQITSFVIMMGSTVILARILTPEDYGLIAIVSALYIFFLLFNDLGFSVSLIRKETLCYEEVSSLAWFNVAISIIFTIIMYSSSWFIADLYNDQNLLLLMQVVSLIFIFGSMTPIHQAVLSRQMKFKEIAYINILSMIFSMTVSIIMALLDFGYWALAANMLGIAFFKSFFSFIFLKWFPKPSMSFYWIKQHFKFGKNITIFNFINYFTRNLDTILIGKYYNPSILGLYNKAYQLLLLPVHQLRGPLYSVGLPALSSLKKNRSGYEKYFLKLVAILTFLSSILVSWMWLNSYEIIMIVLGSQWLTSAILFKTLAVSALIQPVEGLFGLLLISMGLSKKYVYYGFLVFFIMCTSFFIGIHYDIETFVVIYVVANYISFFLSAIYVLKDSPVHIGDYFRPVFLNIFYFFFGAIILDNIVDFNTTNIFLSLSVKTGLFFLLVLLFLIFNQHYRDILKDMANLFLDRKK